MSTGICWPPLTPKLQLPKTSMMLYMNAERKKRILSVITPHLTRPSGCFRKKILYVACVRKWSNQPMGNGYLAFLIHTSLTLRSNF